MKWTSENKKDFMNKVKGLDEVELSILLGATLENRLSYEDAVKYLEESDIKVKEEAQRYAIES